MKYVRFYNIFCYLLCCGINLYLRQYAIACAILCVAIIWMGLPRK